MRRSVFALAALLVALPFTRLVAQDDGDDADDRDDARWLADCRSGRWGGDHRERFCETRPAGYHLAAGGAIEVNGNRNGAVRVRAWDRDSVAVVARVEASAPTAAEAERIAREIVVRAAGGAAIAADGPSVGDGRNWGVSFDVMVPRHTDLTIEAYNGPIGVTGVTGRMSLDGHNGPLALRGVGGDVRARTVNGPLAISLSGSSWSGAGLDASTNNGPVVIDIPRGYSARFETGTTNGPMDIGIPITVQGRVTRSLATTLGSGGAPVRAVTRNGPVVVREGR